MALSKSILVSFTKEFHHAWPSAPAQVLFLRNVHRHILHIKAQIEVKHNDRELEFIMVKHFLESSFDSRDWEIRTSCEDVAEYLILVILNEYGDRDVTVTVMEDNENGAVLDYVKERISNYEEN